MTPSVSGRPNTFLATVAARVVPATAEFDDAQRAWFASIIDRAVSRRPPAIRSQLSAFLFLLRYLSVLRFGRRLDRLSPANQDRVLRWFESGPVPRFRRGMWGLKTLVYMGYYGRPEVWRSIGYAQPFAGNARLGENG